MDPIEGGDFCNQTIFEYYETYLQTIKVFLVSFYDKYSQEFIDYFHQNAQHLAIAIIVYVLFSICFYCFLMRLKLVRHIGTIRDCKNILFVTSHPDDECMFFGPTIVSLSCKPGISVYLLCLSRGDFEKKGKIRKEELFASCKILGIPEANIQVINSTLLPDDPEVNWNQEIVGQIILNFIETYSIDTVLTFDRYGVSNHLNHVSVYYAMAYLFLEKKLPEKSVSRLRKYIALMDLPLTFLLSSKKYVVPNQKRKLIRQAMRAHESQYVWFRKAYMLLSRYIFINSFRQIDVLDLELEFEFEDGRH